EVYGQAGGILNLKLNLSDDGKTDNKFEQIRFDGKNRIETAVKISKENFEKADTVILVNSLKEVDALAASTLAGKEKAPILLIDKNNTPQIVEEEINRLEAKKIILIGGPDSLSDSAVDCIKLEK